MSELQENIEGRIRREVGRSNRFSKLESAIGLGGFAALLVGGLAGLYDLYHPNISNSFLERGFLFGSLGACGIIYSSVSYLIRETRGGK